MASNEVTTETRVAEKQIIEASAQGLGCKVVTTVAIFIVAGCFLADAAAIR